MEWKEVLGGLEALAEVLERMGRWEGELRHTSRDGRGIVFGDIPRVVRVRGLGFGPS